MIALSDTDRQYILNRLDRGHIRMLAENARVVLMAGHAAELCYMPGDATWYSLVIAPIESVLGAPGGGHSDQYFLNQSYVGANKGDVFVIAYMQVGQAVWCERGDDMEWIAQKFDTTPASHLAIAELLKEVLA